MSTVTMIGSPVYEGAVKSEWIDFNQHMNVAYYVLAFDLGIEDRHGTTHPGQCQRAGVPDSLPAAYDERPTTR